MTQNIIVKTIKYVLKEILLDVIYFPVWWYTRGLKNAYNFFVNEVLDWSNRLSIRILFKSLLKPMYGDYSWSGRVISFFMRIIVFIFKLILMIIWLVVLMVLFFTLALLPIFVIYMIILNITGQKGFF